MKKTFPSIAAFALLAAAPFPAAAFTVPPQVTADVKQLVSDLKTIASHASVDPADVAELEADLKLALDGAVAPSIDSVRKLAADAQAALADRKFSAQEEFTIIGDLDAVLVSAGFSDDQIQTIKTHIFSIVTASGVTQADFQLIIADVTVLLADLQGTFIVTTSTIKLTAPNDNRLPGPARAEGAANSATIVSALRAAIGAQASVGINTSSLGAGAYTVSVTKLSTGAKEALGALAVDAAAGESGVGAANFGAGGTPLPAGFDPADVGSISIDGADGAPVLAGQTADAKSVHAGSFELTAGPAAPGAMGSVTLQTKVKPTLATQSFLLYAKKLPASTKLNLYVNGVLARKVKTDAKGQLAVIQGTAAVPTKADGVTPKTKGFPLPGAVNVQTAQSVALQTLDGQVAATGGFSPQ